MGDRRLCQCVEKKRMHAPLSYTYFYVLESDALLEIKASSDCMLND